MPRTTELAVRETSNFLALSTDLAAVTEAIEVNLDGADLTPFDLTRLTVPSGKSTVPRWEVPTLEGGSDVVETLTGIIVFKASVRAWWPRSMDEGGGGTPPSCSSTDNRTGTGKQWATAEDPDPDGLPVTQVCKTCPHAQFGTSGRAQACKQSEQIFLLMETGFLPAVISAPPASLASFKRYMVALSGQGLTYNAVETVLGLEKAQNADKVDYARITFRFSAHLSPEARAAAKAYGDALRPQFQSVTAQAATAPAEENVTTAPADAPEPQVAAA